MKKKTRKTIGNIFKFTTVAQIAFYGYVYYKKFKKKKFNV